MDNWNELVEECNKCTKCKLCNLRHNVVVGTGNINARIMFIGEGPGADEDAQGIPFVGKAGKLMDKAFDGVGIKREEVYIANVIKCRPPNNRNPELDEINSCVDYLKKQICLVNPKIIVLLGNIALKTLIGNENSITASRGKWIEFEGIKTIATYHPAALLRDEDKKIDFWKDLEKIVEYNQNIKF